jgi:Domain of unknown function (DUF5134)
MGHSPFQLANLAVTASGELAFYRHAQPPTPRGRLAAGCPPAAAGGRAPAAGVPGAHRPGDEDVSGPAWLAGSFAILMIVIAGYCAARLAISRLRSRNTERDADALHVLMGVAMAGMLEPRFTSIPVIAWRVVFAAAAAWFAWKAIRPVRQAGGARRAHPAAHAVECAAMVYMLLPVGSWRSGQGARMAMPGMGQGTTMGNPALTLVLALFMLGYVLWTVDRLAHLSRTPAVAAAYPQPAGIPVLAPRLAASYKITMAVIMGYMLLMML